LHAVSDPAAVVLDDEQAAPAADDRSLAVRVEGLCIHFDTVHENLSANLKHAVRNVHRRSKTKHVVQALRDVSFTVPRGSVYGVIGHNGAGKSTLFRVLAGVLPPDDGRIELWGRVTPLLSLGVGFNRELTGRENILLGGLAAGLHREEVAAHSQDILEFAELGDAIDRPMRTYSSGMFGRLGFAIAAHLDPEIILIDEALSAGDASFKDRCAEKLKELVEGDCTVMIVTHGVSMVQQMGERCLWLDHGRVVAEGEAGEIVESYLEHQGMADSKDVAVRIDI
jgi:ABC-type polysaccharide/polyol phosphate transport system ATPase subunit